jgi:stress-induced morphogen
MVEPNVIEQRIREHVPDVAHFALEDLTGGKDHYQAVVVSAAFAGKTRVQQHQMIYRALGELMAGPVHALALTTYTPEAWSKRGKSLL